MYYVDVFSPLIILEHNILRYEATHLSTFIAYYMYFISCQIPTLRTILGVLVTEHTDIVDNFIDSAA